MIYGIPGFKLEKDVVDRRTQRLAESGVRDASSRGEGIAVNAAHWARAVLGNGLGHFAEALAAAIYRLIADPAERRRLEERAVAASKGSYSWDRIAEQTTAVYERVLA